MGKWAGRISTSIVDFALDVFGTMLSLLKKDLSSPKVWQAAHQTALSAWNASAGFGILAQGFAYSKKMAGYFLEILKQSFERSVKAHGLEVTEEEKKEISNFFDDAMVESAGRQIL